MVKARSEREIEKLALKFFPNRFSLAPLSQKKSFLIDTSAPVTIRAHRDRALDGSELSLWTKAPIVFRDLSSEPFFMQLRSPWHSFDP